VRAGQFKTPFGFEQLYADPRLITLERSLVNDRLTVSRQLGVQLHGELFDRRMSYAVGAFNGNGVNNNFNDDDRFLLAGRLAGTVWRGKLFGKDATLAAGANALSSDDTNIPLGSELGFDSTPATPDRDNVFAGKRQASGVDSQLQIGPFDLWVEYLRSRFEPDSARPRAEVTADGGYVQAGYFVLPGKLQVVVKLETFDPRDDLDDDSTDEATLGASYYLKGHDLKLMLNLVRADGPGDLEEEDKVLARLQVIF
jgi:phosphate-selective porin OprO/OprP